MSPASTSNPVSATKAQVAALTMKLQSLGGTTAQSPIVVESGKYDFKNAVFPIRLQGVTIRAQTGATVVLKNIQLQIDLDSADDVVIQDIAFRSNGAVTSNGPVGPRDAIVLESLGTTTPPSPDPRSAIHVRITRCSFDGYFDIAIDSTASAARPNIVATIEHCLFYDDNPGRPKKPKVNGLYAFANRGAINISNGPGKSLFILANNVFINVWRRSPRVANGNQAFIYNNLLFRWGIGNDDTNGQNGTNEWFGIATDEGAQAAIYANRFIPYSGKKSPRKTVSIGPGTTVDLGIRTPTTPPSPDLTNDFNGANGGAPGANYQPPTSASTIDVSTWYTNAGLGTAPTPISRQQMNWRQLVLDAGPANFDRPGVKTDLLALLPAPTT